MKKLNRIFSVVTAIFLVQQCSIWPIVQTKTLQTPSSTLRPVIVNDNPVSHKVSGRKGAVAVENERCSNAGLNILKDGGNAVDSAIAAALCIGVINSFATGIGGGGFMLIRTSSGKYDSINYRETAPAAATVEMYGGNKTLSQIGGLAVGVPGELRGYELAHKRYGKLPWPRLFEDAIDVARNGFVVNELLQRMLGNAENWMKESPTWSKVFLPNGTLAKVGDIIKRTAYADTLETIAQEGPNAFYKGPIAESLIHTVTDEGGIMTIEDLASYKAVQQPVINTQYHQYKVYTTTAPTSGPILLNALNLVEPFRFNHQKTDTGRHYRTTLDMHRLTEALKFSYAARSELGDPLFSNNTDMYDEIITKNWADNIRQKITDTETHKVEYYQSMFEGNDPHGTMHLSVVDENGSAVALTSTINLYFGSRVMDAKTGIILNNEQDDFSSPGFSNAFGYAPSPHNFIAPGKRPLSSITPVIIEKGDGGVYLVLGASGGSKIITGTLNTIVNTLDYELDLFDAVGAPRLHHQLMPDKVDLEKGFDPEIERGLKELGHEVTYLKEGSIPSVVQAILRHENGTLDAVSDPRKFGLAAAF